MEGSMRENVKCLSLVTLLLLVSCEGVLAQEDLSQRERQFRRDRDYNDRNDRDLKRYKDENQQPIVEQSTPTERYRTIYRFCDGTPEACSSISRRPE
jgi:hypothetical protein